MGNIIDIALNTGGYDANFQRDTDTAVKAVQMYANIDDNGRVENNTIYAINQLILERNGYIASGNSQAELNLKK